MNTAAVSSEYLDLDVIIAKVWELFQPGVGYAVAPPSRRRAAAPNLLQ